MYFYVLKKIIEVCRYITVNRNYKEDKNIVMYCTGGIRCEKASAYFKHNGFKNVFQLEGGIINYAKQIKEENLESKFIFF